MERERKPMDTWCSWPWKKLLAEDEDGNDIVVSIRFGMDCGIGCCKIEMLFMLPMLLPL